MIADLGEARFTADAKTMTMVGLTLFLFLRSCIGALLGLTLTHTVAPPQVGTPGYTAPEVLKGEHYGPPADVCASLSHSLLTLSERIVTHARLAYHRLVCNRGMGDIDSSATFSRHAL